MIRWLFAIGFAFILQVFFFILAPLLLLSHQGALSQNKEEGQKTYELETLVLSPKKTSEVKEIKPLPMQKMAQVVDEIKPVRSTTFNMDLSIAGGGSGEGSTGGVAVKSGTGNGSGLGSNAQQVIYEPGQVEEEASVMRESMAQTPLRAKREGVSGKVELFLVVESNGIVSNIQILKEDPLGYGFGKEAQKAMQGFLFKPAKIQGVPVRQKYRKQFIFEVN